MIKEMLNKLLGQPKKEVRVIHEHNFRGGFPNAQMSTGSSPISNPFQVFEALANNSDRTPITTGAMGQILASGSRWLPSPPVNFQRLMLAAISDYLYDNNGLVSYGVDMIVNYSVPVIPKAATDDAGFNEKYNGFFKDWMRVADYSGRFSYPVMQEVACKSIDKAGDFGFIATSENGFVQLQGVESWQIGALKIPNGLAMRIIDGVGMDEKGVLAGYVMQNKTGVEIVSPNVMKLLYDPDRYYAFRGMSAIRRGANDIRDHSDLKGFEKKAAKIHAAIAAWIKGGPMTEDDWDGMREEEMPPVQDQSPANSDGTDNTVADGPQKAKFTIADLLGGDIPVMDDGQELQLLDNKRPGHGTIDFLTELGGFFISGLGLPPAFFSDVKLTGPNIRAVMGKAQKKFDRRQNCFADLGDWIYKRVIADGIAKGQIPASPQWDKCTHQFPSRLTIDLGDQATNERDDVQCGQMSRQERFGNRSKDWQAETDQIDREVDYIFDMAKKKATKYSIPIETVLAAYGIMPQQKQQNPQQAGPLPGGNK